MSGSPVSVRGQGNQTGRCFVVGSRNANQKQHFILMHNLLNIHSKYWRSENWAGQDPLWEIQATAYRLQGNNGDLPLSCEKVAAEYDLPFPSDRNKGWEYCVDGGLVCSLLTAPSINWGIILDKREKIKRTTPHSQNTITNKIIILIPMPLHTLVNIKIMGNR